MTLHDDVPAPVSAYEVIVTREDHTWLAEVPAVPGAHTFARSLSGLAKSVREVVILMADLGDDATGAEVHLPGERRGGS